MPGRAREVAKPITEWDGPRVLHRAADALRVSAMQFDRTGRGPAASW